MTTDSATDPRPLAFSYVRFSSEKQRQGASLERQTEAAQRWADENGYVLDKSLNLNDEAVSAFRGDNTTVGKLATFKALTEQRLIPQGSVLIVENLDRISRQSHRKAARVLEDIEAALLRLTSDKIADRDYWFATVDRIEAGKHPTDNRPLTVSDLDAWVERCQRSAQRGDQRTPENEDQPSHPHAQDRRVLHPRP